MSLRTLQLYRNRRFSNNIKLKFFALLALALSLGTARADDAYFLNVLYGHWRDPKSGDQYRFDRDKTYVFRAGAAKARSGNLAHRGAWEIYDPQPNHPRDFSPYGLMLNAVSREVRVKGKVSDEPANRVFRFLFRRATKKQPEVEDPNRIFIGKTLFVRVK